MTINKSQLGNKRVALNTLADAIDTNIEAAATVTVADAGNLYTGTNVEACLAEIAGTGRTTETVKGNADNLDDLERSGSTVEVGDAATDADRDITLTIKNGASSPAAVQNYAVVGVKVTVGDGAGNDTGVAATINSTLDTSDGLTVVAENGEQISPSNHAAISDSGEASLLAFTKSDGTLKVNVKKTTTNTFVFVHFLLPNGSVVSSTEVELNNAE